MNAGGCRPNQPYRLNSQFTRHSLNVGQFRQTGRHDSVYGRASIVAISSIFSILRIVLADRFHRAPEQPAKRSRGIEMLTRKLLILCVVFASIGSSGCCIRRILCDECCDPCDRGAFTYYAGKSCGDAYYGDWHSHPPKCDPCDGCGNFVGRGQRAGHAHGPANEFVVGKAGCESCGH